MKIVATFNIYNEAQFIREAIESVLWCDRIIVVDGAFEGFPTSNGKPQSNDGTLEILEELAQKHRNKMVVLNLQYFSKGLEKVYVCLSQVHYGEYFIHMNGDEVFEGDFVGVRKHIKSYALPMYQIKEYKVGDENDWYWIPKILLKTPTLRFNGRHVVRTNTFDPTYRFEGERGAVAPIEANLPFGKIRHLKNQRIKERKQQNRRWLDYYYSHQFKEIVL